MRTHSHRARSLLRQDYSCLLIAGGAILTTISMFLGLVLVPDKFGVGNQSARVSVERDMVVHETVAVAPLVRLLFFCHCEEKPHIEAFALALQRIPTIAPQNTRMYSHIIHSQSADDNTKVLCEDEIERLVGQAAAGQASVASQVFYSERFSTVCHKTRKINIPPLQVKGHGQSSFNHSAGEWAGGAHLVAHSSEASITHLRDWGEVWQSKNVKCNPADASTLHTYRSRGITESQKQQCNVIHLPTIIRWALDIHKKRSLDLNSNESLKEMLTHRLSYDEAKAELRKKDKFCGLVTLTTWKDFYPIDALVRHALCRLLTRQYKQCDALAAWKGEYCENSGL